MGLHALDRVIGDEWPNLATDAELQAFEAVPYNDRIAANSTYEALQRGAARAPGNPAIKFLPNASADDDPVSLTHAQFMERVTQVANALHSLGVGSKDVVGLLLPLILKPSMRCTALRRQVSPTRSIRFSNPIRLLTSSGPPGPRS